MIFSYLLKYGDIMFMISFFTIDTMWRVDFSENYRLLVSYLTPWSDRRNFYILFHVIRIEMDDRI